MAGQMYNSTAFNGLPIIVNTTDGHSTLLSPIPLATIVTVTVCIMGILANIVVILVIILSSLRTSVFMNFIMSLAVFDTLFLVSIVNAQRGIFGVHLIKPSLLYCRFTIFCYQVTEIISSWVTVLISLERYIAIFYPFKVHIYCTKKRALVAVIIITLLACTSQIPVFFTCSLVFIGQRPKCLGFVSDTWNDMMLIIFLLFTYSFVPLIIITIFNVLMIRRIQDQSAFRASSQGQHSVSSSSTKHLSLFAMMVSLCMVFAVTSLPGMLMIIVNHSCKFMTGSHCIVIEGWLYRILFMLHYINHGVNFFLYCLTGSVFRQALFQLFKCRH